MQFLAQSMAQVHVLCPYVTSTQHVQSGMQQCRRSNCPLHLHPKRLCKTAPFKAHLLPSTSWFKPSPSPHRNAFLTQPNSRHDSACHMLPAVDAEQTTMRALCAALLCTQVSTLYADVSSAGSQRPQQTLPDAFILQDLSSCYPHQRQTLPGAFEFLLQDLSSCYPHTKRP